MVQELNSSFIVYINSDYHPSSFSCLVGDNIKTVRIKE